jgi:hypothetical protein
MAKVIYVSNVSLDGFTEEEDSGSDWTEMMAVWETDPALAAQSELWADFAQVWQAADEMVFSTTLDAVSTARSRVERSLDPASMRCISAIA